MTSYILSRDEMYRADRATIEAGTPSRALMQNAAAAAAKIILERYGARPCAVLCGPGNNGGDGMLIAQHLHKNNWPVKVILFAPREELKGDAAWALSQYEGPVELYQPSVFDRKPLVIDAIFGIGLARALDGAERAAVEKLNFLKLPCVAIDIPSGVDADTGAVLGVAPKCEITIAFGAKKRGHVLLPGKSFCGELMVADIGIGRETVVALNPVVLENTPSLWRREFPQLSLDTHKYMRGMVLLRGGKILTGAAKLAARASRRIGAGGVMIACDEESLPLYAADQPGMLLSKIESVRGFLKLAKLERTKAILLGPGQGVSHETRKTVLKSLTLQKPIVLDADAITSFAGRGQQLALQIQKYKTPLVITPHEGEFARLLPELADHPNKVEAAQMAAKFMGAAFILKGSDTVIADANGNVVINTNAPPTLATAGSGDVLAGFCAGLLAQGMDMFRAASAAVWLHAEAANIFGPGLIAEDLPEKLPEALRETF